MKKRKHVKDKEIDSEIMDAITIMSRDLVPPQTSIRWFADIITVSSQKFLVLIDSSSAWMFGAYPILGGLKRQFEETLNRVSTQTTLPLTIVTRNKPPFFLKGKSTLQLLLVAGNAPVSADTVIGDWIYNEDGSKYAVKNLIEKVFDVLSETSEEEVQTCLEILRHCWNAFPHKRLQDKSPFETGQGLWILFGWNP